MHHGGRIRVQAATGNRSGAGVHIEAGRSVAMTVVDQSADALLDAVCLEPQSNGKLFRGHLVEDVGHVVDHQQAVGGKARRVLQNRSNQTPSATTVSGCNLRLYIQHQSPAENLSLQLQTLVSS